MKFGLHCKLKLKFGSSEYLCFLNYLQQIWAVNNQVSFYHHSYAYLEEKYFIKYVYVKKYAPVDIFLVKSEFVFIGVRQRILALCFNAQLGP